MKTLILFFTFSFIFVQTSFAQTAEYEPGFHPAPGNMGANAFTAWSWRVNDARIVGDRVLIDVGYRHVKGVYGESNETGVVRVEIPFRELVSVELTYLGQYHNLNDRAYEAFNAKNRTGFEMGDLIVGFKFDVLSEKVGRPAVSLMGSVKTAPGSDENHQFTNTAGYSLGALAAKELLIRSGVIKKIRILAEASFFCWDDGERSQNDAFRVGLASNFELRNKLLIKAGVHSIIGWREKDKPVTLYVEAEKNVNNAVSFYASVDKGLTPDANQFTASAGVRVKVLRNYYARVKEQRRRDAAAAATATPTPSGPLD